MTCLLFQRIVRLIGGWHSEVPHEGVGLPPTLSSSMATSFVVLTHVNNRQVPALGLEVSVSDWDPWCAEDL